METYNIFQAIYMSFYSKRLYRDVAKNWGGKAFLYLLLILALSWIVFVYQFQVALNIGYAKFSNEIIGQVPVLTIKNGILSTPENKPYLIKSKSNETLAIIDTTGKHTSIESENVPILVTQTEVKSKTKPNEIRTYIFPKNFSMTIIPKNFNEHAKYYVSYAWILFFILFLLGSYIYRLIQAVLYSIIGKIFGAIVKVPLTYGQTILIMLVAITPVIVISTILEAFHIIFPLQHLFYLILGLGYLFFGMLANKE